jgi:hypothetical protein
MKNVGEAAGLVLASPELWNMWVWHIDVVQKLVPA